MRRSTRIIHRCFLVESFAWKAPPELLIEVSWWSPTKKAPPRLSFDSSRWSYMIMDQNSIKKGRQAVPQRYNPILNNSAIRILIHPVTNLEMVTDAIPTCVVSGFASVMPRPTGMKSQAH